MNTLGRSAFGARLAQARKHAKLTQINAAKAVKMSQGTLAELEQEGQGSSYTAQLAEIYGVNPNWLATGKGQMHIAEKKTIKDAVEPPPHQTIDVEWPFSASRADYEQLSSNDKVALNTVVSGFITGSLAIEELEISLAPSKRQSKIHFEQPDSSNRVRKR